MSTFVPEFIGQKYRWQAYRGGVKWQAQDDSVDALKDLQGKTIERIEGMEAGSDDVHIFTTDGDIYWMGHVQDCCESVDLHEVIGDPQDLIGNPLLVAEERSDDGTGGETDAEDGWAESFTWTFYTFRTIRGTVDLRWYGSSNGYYSESVYVEKIKRNYHD